MELKWRKTFDQNWQLFWDERTIRCAELSPRGSDWRWALVLSYRVAPSDFNPDRSSFDSLDCGTGPWHYNCFWPVSASHRAAMAPSPLFKRQMNVTELKERDPKRFEKEYYKWQEHTLDYEWWDCIYEDFTDGCAALCVQVDDITFSGFYSQGDGAAFTGRVYVHKWMAHKGFDVTHPAAYLGCKDDGSYVRLETGRGNNMRANLEECANQTAPSGIFAGLEQEVWEELVDAQISDLSIEDEVLSWCEELANKLYRDLRDEYEHLTSEEMFIEHCECNEVTFEENEDAFCTND